MTTFNIATLNVNGLNDDIKVKSLFNTLQTLNCDIIALQETHITLNNIEKIKKAWQGYSIWNPAPSSYSSGTAILLGSKITKANQHMDNTGRITSIKIKLVFFDVYV